LGHFRETELVIWLRRWMNADTARANAATLFAETDGDARLIYNKLLDPDFWKSLNVLN